MVIEQQIQSASSVGCFAWKSTLDERWFNDWLFLPPCEEGSWCITSVIFRLWVQGNLKLLYNSGLLLHNFKFWGCKFCVKCIVFKNTTPAADCTYTSVHSKHCLFNLCCETTTVLICASWNPKCSAWPWWRSTCWVQRGDLWVHSFNSINCFDIFKWEMS